MSGAESNTGTVIMVVMGVPAFINPRHARADHDSAAQPGGESAAESLRASPAAVPSHELRRFSRQLRRVRVPR